MKKELSSLFGGNLNPAKRTHHRSTEAITWLKRRQSVGGQNNKIMQDENINEDETRTRPETANRIRQVQHWLRDAMPTPEIFANGMQRWGIQRRMMRNYFSMALKEMNEDSAIEMAEQRALHIEMRQQLFNDMRKRENPNDFAAIELLRDMAKLQGLYEPHSQKLKPEDVHVTLKLDTGRPVPPKIAQTQFPPEV